LQVLWISDERRSQDLPIAESATLGTNIQAEVYSISQWFTVLNYQETKGEALFQNIVSISIGVTEWAVS